MQETYFCRVVLSASGGHEKNRKKSRGKVCAKHGFCEFSMKDIEDAEHILDREADIM